MPNNDKYEPASLAGFLRDPYSQNAILRGFVGSLGRGAAGVAGAPVDLLTLGMRGLGYSVPDNRVVGSSEWIGRQLENAGMMSKARNPLAELLANAVSPDPMDAVRLSSMAIPVVAEAAKMDDASKYSDDVIELFHGSPEKLVEIKDGGLFGGLFATPRKVSARTFGDNLHSIPLNKKDILSNYDLNYELDYDQVKKAFNDVIDKNLHGRDPDNEILWKAIVEDKNAHDHFDPDELRAAFDTDEDIGDIGWLAQSLRGQLAKRLGFKAVEMSDETGTSYLVLPGAKVSPIND